MDTFTLRVLADVAAGRVYIDELKTVRVDPDVKIDPANEHRYVRIVRELHRASVAVGGEPVGPGTLRRLRLTVPGGYESTEALAFVDGALKAVTR
ncbi:hypothetical protein O7626_40395 [Micromonospora sp. WMMD1102]|uniref:hypothetical protein n=1 Tax=Micromonospora sp. WMMD1102 TaxID=3016105 RepID=UPI00241522D3|nr:hypothetical protein [Micromonospora sp. WMMD1102]MDG4792079.1 hypothetical protein [Micromonospora sp. WMMD1102]